MQDHPTTFAQWNQAIAPLFAMQDDKQRLELLVAAIRVMVPVEAVMVTLESRQQMPQLLYDCGIPPRERKRYINKYLSAAYLLDPLHMAQTQGLAPGCYHLAAVAADNFYNSDYYLTYFRGTGLVDDVYFVSQSRQEGSLSMALGRRQGQSRFSTQEIELLTSLTPVVLSVLDRYWDTLQTPAAPVPPDTQAIRQHIEQAFEHFGCSLLTERERQVVHLILQGHSAKATAQTLGISPDTVQMHRKNMYAKLQVSSQSELFSLFLAALSHEQRGPDEDPLCGYLQSRSS